MPTLTPFEAWYGRDDPPPKIIPIRAGPITLEFQDGDLRYLRLGGQELVRRIYVAIRDHNWNTIPAQISNLTVETGDDHFRIEYDALHVDQLLRYRWHAILLGKPDGTVESSMDGAAESVFRFNRIGFCLLHPIQGIAGRPYRAITPGGPISGQLPELVAPQQMVNGYEAPIFPSCSSLAIELEGGIQVVSEFEGDLFEMEDQRNWTDGSFKTYCTPLALGYPKQAVVGQSFHQKIIIRVDFHGLVAEPVRVEQGPTYFSLDTSLDQQMPQIGFGISAREVELGERELDLIAGLHPEHLKIELHLRNREWLVELHRALGIARRVGSQLELALFMHDAAQADLERLKDILQNAPVARVLVFHEDEASSGTTSGRWMEWSKKVLGGVLPQVEWVGGTNGNFAELNRQRPELAWMDGVAYTINPQVHAFDERSLLEAIQAQRDTLLTARSFSGDLHLHISSVTLKPPFNQAATEAEGPGDSNQLPANVDPRQMSLFAAGWTAGSLRSLTAGGAASVTYYEMAGWRGLLETAAGSRLPARFHSLPGLIYPVYWIFAFLAEAHGARLVQTEAQRPLLLDGLALEKDGRLWLLVSNYLPAAQEARISGLPDGKVELFYLNEDTVLPASRSPEEFLKSGSVLSVRNGELRHTFKPYETLLITLVRDKKDRTQTGTD